MSVRWDDHVALVTGGARGLGFAVARRLAELGAKVALVDAPRSRPFTLGYEVSGPDELAAAVERLTSTGARAIGVSADVRSRPDVAAAVETIERDLGPISLVVTAASVFGHVEAGRMSDDEWDEVVDTNLHGVYNVTRETLPRLTERGRGRVLALVGDEARRGVAGVSHVAAAGWSVIGLAKSIALESARAGVAVNVICSGAIDGAPSSSPDFARLYGGGDAGADVVAALEAKHPDGEAWVPIESVVDAAIFVLGAPGTAMTGSVFDISNGLSALNSA
jgi:NAD(P)-dependent dehydrogenase (short-subunit alcohol dehydrogenase family)